MFETLQSWLTARKIQPPSSPVAGTVRDQGPGCSTITACADPRRFQGRPVPAWAHACALRDDAAGLPYDTPKVQGVRRDALAWWIPLLGDALVC